MYEVIRISLEKEKRSGKKQLPGDFWILQGKRKLLLGSGTEIIHKEHHCFFKQDVTKVMYSKATPEGTADRVIMGYVGTTHHYLEPAIKALKKSGGVLHYHETVPESLARTRPQERIKKAACSLGRKVEILETRRIKKYSPGVLHVVVDARILE